MATIAPTSADISRHQDRGVFIWTWAALTENDTAAALDLADFEAAAVEFSGTFGSATVVLQGSVLGTTYTTLKDLGGTNISQTAAAWQSVREQPRLVRPSASGGSSQSLTITLLVRRMTAAQRV